VHPGDLKASVVEIINRLLAPIIKKFKEPEMQKLTNNAYPKPSKSKFCVGVLMHHLIVPYKI